MATPTSILDSCAATETRLRELASRRGATIPAAAVPAEFRRAAVLALVGCDHQRPALVVTERAADLRAHAAEICLPGGRLDPGETPEGGALREAVEEVGIDPAAARVAGRLDEAWSKGRNHVVPVVAWYDAPLARLAPASPEVARVFVIPLAAIARPEAHRLDVSEHEGHTFENDVVDTDACELYGLTADIVLDLVAWLTGTERDRVPRRLADLERALGTLGP